MHPPITPESRSPLDDRGIRIYLTGFMGSGKSTIGPILANTIGYGFVDTDREIEQRTGRSVNMLFQQYGELHFRETERALVRELSSRPRIVVSLGGGTMLDRENLEVIASSGIVIYLKTTPGHLFRRLHHKTDRPVLKDAKGERLNDDELNARIQSLHSEREPIYTLADFTIPTDEQRVGLTVDAIVRKVRRYLR